MTESADPEANVSEIAPRNGVSRGLLNIWRRQARQAPREDGAFVRLRVAESCEEEGQASTRQVASTGAGERIEIAPQLIRRMRV